MERGPVPTLSLVCVPVPWEGTSGNTVGDVARVWGSFPAPAVSLYSSILNGYHKTWVLADRTVQDTPQKDLCLS